MRSEQEMFQLILDTARGDERILAAYLNGSRTNPNAKRDIFQDYDIMYVVEETKSFREDKSWIDRFGNRLYMQYPEDSCFFESDPTHCYGWLMQLEDGNRLDLHVCTIDYAIRDVRSDELCRILLDKNGILPAIPEPSDRSHWVPRPDEKMYADSCNEFWWCLNNLGKNLWRGEVVCAQAVMNDVLRAELLRMLSWKAGIATGFTCSVGKEGKDLWKWIPEEEWRMFLETYAEARVDKMWRAAKTMCMLFAKASWESADALGFPYNDREARASFDFFQKTEKLPRDAKKIE